MPSPLTPQDMDSATQTPSFDALHDLLQSLTEKIGTIEPSLAQPQENVSGTDFATTSLDNPPESVVSICKELRHSLQDAISICQRVTTRERAANAKSTTALVSGKKQSPDAETLAGKYKHQLNELNREYEAQEQLLQQANRSAREVSMTINQSDNFEDLIQGPSAQERMLQSLQRGLNKGRNAAKAARSELRDDPDMPEPQGRIDVRPMRAADKDSTRPGLEKSYSQPQGRDGVLGPNDQIVVPRSRRGLSRPAHQDLEEEQPHATLEKATHDQWLQRCLLHVNGRFDSLLRMATGFTTGSGPDPIELLQDMGTMLKDVKTLAKDTSIEHTAKADLHRLSEQLSAEIDILSLYIGSNKPLARQAPMSDQRQSVSPGLGARQRPVSPELSLSSDVELAPVTEARKRSTILTGTEDLERPRKLPRVAPRAFTATNSSIAEDQAPLEGDDAFHQDAHIEALMSGALPVGTDPAHTDMGRAVVDLTADSSGDEDIRRSPNLYLDEEEDDQAEDRRSDLDRLMGMIVFGWDASDAEKAQVRKQFQPFIENSKKSLDDIIKALDMHAFGPPTKTDGGPYPRGCVLAWLGHIPGSAAIGPAITQRSCGFCKDKASYICGWLKHLPGVATGYGARGLDGKVPKAFVQYNGTARPRTVPFNGRQVRWVLKKRKETKHDAQETFISFRGEAV